MQDLAVTDDVQLRSDASEIEEILEEARALSSPYAWQRVEEALRRVVQLYGAGLAHVIAHARSAGVVGVTFDRLLGDDELLSNLLVLHSLHPLTTEQRVRRALDALGTRFGIELELVGIADGVAYLEATASDLPDAAGQALARRVIEAAAPELASIELARLAA